MLNTRAPPKTTTYIGSPHASTPRTSTSSLQQVRHHVVVASPPVVQQVYDPTHGLQAQITELQQALGEERWHRQELERKLLIAFSRIEKLEAPSVNPYKIALQNVENRGNIRLNYDTGHVSLCRPIAFFPRTTKDEPTAVFKNVGVAKEICRDIAEVANIFACPVIIEGHTKGGEGDFWKTLANDRAYKVMEMVVDSGAPGDNISAQGLPGRMGSNEAQTVVVMEIANLRGLLESTSQDMNGSIVHERAVIPSMHLMHYPTVPSPSYPTVPSPSYGGRHVLPSAMSQQVFSPHISTRVGHA